MNIFHPTDQRGLAYVRLFALQSSIASLGRVIFFGGNAIIEDDCFRAIDDDIAEVKRLLREGDNYEHRPTSLVPTRNRREGVA